MGPDNTFLGAYLKVDRASHHIQSLLVHTQPLCPHWYEVVWRAPTSAPVAVNIRGDGADPNKPVRELAYVPKKPMGYFLALMIGDAVHNLRAALDHAATAVVRATGGSTKFVTFPFHEKREDLVASSGPMKAIQAALPNSDVETFFRDTIKPYRGGNTDLWTLTKIDKIDKHNFILPTISIVGAKHRNLVTDRITVGETSMNGDAHSDKVLYRMPIRDEDAGKYEVDVAVEILFPKGEFFSELPVIPQLAKLSQTVAETLLIFEEFALANGAPVGVTRV